MKRILILVFSLLGIFCLSIYEPLEYKIQFNVSSLADSSIGINSGQVFNHGHGYIDVVWNTGDTGATLKITKPGMYICSVKDVWRIEKTGGYYYQHGVYLLRYPSRIVQNSYTTPLVSGLIHQHWHHTYKIMGPAGLEDITCNDSSWIVGSTYHWIEHTPSFDGFWSGMLDTIIITKEINSTEILNATVMAGKNSFFSGKLVRVNDFKKWRATF